MLRQTKEGLSRRPQPTTPGLAPCQLSMPALRLTLAGLFIRNNNCERIGNLQMAAQCLHNPIPTPHTLGKEVMLALAAACCSCTKAPTTSASSSTSNNATGKCMLRTNQMNSKKCQECTQPLSTHSSAMPNRAVKSSQERRLHMPPNHTGSSHTIRREHNSDKPT